MPPGWAAGCSWPDCQASAARPCAAPHLVPALDGLLLEGGVHEVGEEGEADLGAHHRGLGPRLHHVLDQAWRQQGRGWRRQAGGQGGGGSRGGGQVGRGGRAASRQDARGQGQAAGARSCFPLCGTSAGRPSPRTHPSGRARCARRARSRCRARAPPAPRAACPSTGPGTARGCSGGRGLSWAGALQQAQAGGGGQQAHCAPACVALQSGAARRGGAPSRARRPPAPSCLPQRSGSCARAARCGGKGQAGRSATGQQQPAPQPA